MELTPLQQKGVNSLIHSLAPLSVIEEYGPLVFARGEGAYVYDESGKPYLEGMSGLWCAGLGFGDEELIEAGKQQLDKLPFYHVYGGRSSEQAIELAEKIKELVPSNFQKVFFTCSGSEANDTQVKFIWYYNNARGLNKKKKIISRVNSYHGGTIMSASLSGVPIAHMGFDLPLEYVLHTDCPHYYRYGKPGESESEFCNRLIASLRELIECEGADTIAAFIAEPIMGAGGVIIPPKGYYGEVQKLLRENDIIFIDDEVMNGFGRTGNWWGFESMEFLPDTITIAKQLTSAYAPLGAVLLPNEMYESFVGQSKKFGVFGHGFTYGGHPLSCAIGLKAIEIYQKRNIVERVRDLSKIFEARMKKIAEHPLVGETRYKGLLGGIEIVADKKTKTPFPMHAGVGTICMHQMLRKGVILHAIIDTISVCPPMIIKEDELNHLFDSLEAGLNATMELLKSRPNPA